MALNRSEFDASVQNVLNILKGLVRMRTIELIDTSHYFLTYVKMSSFVLRVLALTLGLFFVFSGTLKVTSSVNAEIYKEMVMYNVYISKNCFD